MAGDHDQAGPKGAPRTDDQAGPKGAPRTDDQAGPKDVSPKGVVRTAEIPRQTRPVYVPPTTISKLIKDYFLAIAGAAMVAILLRVFVVEAFRIPTDFMSPGLMPGDLIFVNKLDHNPRRGDIVVFSFPNDPTKDYIKRVIGVEGDSIEIRDGQVILNGKSVSKNLSDGVVEEEIDGHRYLAGWKGSTPEARRMIPVKVPEGQIFVLGDNRTKGQDSRGWGFLQVGSIKGKAAIIWFSTGATDNGKTYGVRWSRVFKRVN